jgi:hypothetical protein
LWYSRYGEKKKQKNSKNTSKGKGKEELMVVFFDQGKENSAGRKQKFDVMNFFFGTKWWQRKRDAILDCIKYTSFS